MNAKPVVDSYQILSAYSFSEGDFAIEVSCPDYDAYKALPAGMEFDGRVYGLTGWNSDRGVACYKTGARFGRAIK